MSLKKVNNPEKNVAELELFIAKDVFEAEVLKVYKKNAPKINVPGFRKGKAPKSIIEKMYGKGVFYEEALNNLIPGEYDAAVKESGIEPVAQPEISAVDMTDEGVELTAKVFVKPEINVTAYKGLEAEKVVRTVTDADVDREVDMARERNSRLIEVTDRAAAMDDTANIDYLGKVDGVAFEGGEAKGHDLKLGSGQFIPGFEEQIVGHNIGETFDINVKFPEEYHAEELKGKDAVFTVTLNALKVKELPALDDEFAKDVSEFDTLAEYKADVKAKIEKRYNDAAEGAVAEQLYDALIANIEGEIPQVMFDQEVDSMVNDYAYRMQSQGIDLDMYFKYTGTTIDDLKTQMKPGAERQVKVRLALEKLVALENITPSDEDVEAEYKTVAEAYKMEIEKVKEALDVETVKKDLAMRKASDFLKENAKITEVSAEEKEKAAKEAAEKAKAEKPAPKKRTTTKKTAEKTEAKAEGEAEKAEKPKTTRKKKTETEDNQ
ncbi:MAG: trigger factor [Ruminococcaceae bacterium]|nr:trigger factor [Oscillospiraceae bacterium]